MAKPKKRADPTKEEALEAARCLEWMLGLRLDKSGQREALEATAAWLHAQIKGGAFR